MVKLFEPRAEKKGSSISLIGKTFAEMEAYNSFQFIPLILLDNAIKYTFPGHHIRVYLHEENDLIWLKVSSYGWLVPEDYRQRIFAKYERGPHATDQHSQGMGLGLYMANAIALAHDTKIVYQPHPETGEKGDNQFSVAIHGAT
jgi:K+-sensing histidine kinase KdpD